MKDHDITSAARGLRKKLQRRDGAPLNARERLLACTLLEGFGDLLDRVVILEQQHRHYHRQQLRTVARVDALQGWARMLGAPEDWTVPDPDETGALVTAAQANAIGASGAGELVPLSSPAAVT